MLIKASSRTSTIPSSDIDSNTEVVECSHLSTLITSSAHAAFDGIKQLTMGGVKSQKPKRCTWTYPEQQEVVREELESRSQELQMDKESFRKLKDELRKTGATTGFGALQMMDQQLIESLSKRRISEAARSA